jgi:hypothetical protein
MTDQIVAAAEFFAAADALIADCYGWASEWGIGCSSRWSYLLPSIQYQRCWQLSDTV